jgi:DNA-binding transcriptional ArsR family regulator
MPVHTQSHDVTAPHPQGWVETTTLGQVANLLVGRSGGPAQHPGDPRLSGQPAELLGVSRQNLSNHLACLRGCRLVVAVPEGRRAHYELADARLAHALGDLLELVLSTDPTLCPANTDQDCC